MLQPRPDQVAQFCDTLPDDATAPIIKAMVELIVRETQPHPLAVVLFGSRAQGTHRPTSDADLLVVVPEGTNTRKTAASIDDLLPFAGVEVDIVATTPSRLLAARGDCGSVLHWAQERGITLYRANDDHATNSNATGGINALIRTLPGA